MQFVAVAVDQGRADGVLLDLAGLEFLEHLARHLAATAERRRLGAVECWQQPRDTAIELSTDQNCRPHRLVTVFAADLLGQCV